MDQSLVDYNQDGTRLVYLVGITDADTTSSSWMLENQILSTTDSFETDLSVGVHTLIYTTTNAGGASRSDAVRITVLSEEQAIAAWTTLDEATVSNRRILAAQDFTELPESLADDPLVRSYPSSEFPVNEDLGFWGFTFERT